MDVDVGLSDDVVVLGMDVVDGGVLEVDVVMVEVVVSSAVVVVVSSTTVVVVSCWVVVVATVVVVVVVVLHFHFFSHLSVLQSFFTHSLHSFLSWLPVATAGNANATNNAMASSPKSTRFMSLPYSG